MEAKDKNLSAVEPRLVALSGRQTASQEMPNRITYWDKCYENNISSWCDVSGGRVSGQEGFSDGVTLELRLA